MEDATDRILVWAARDEARRLLKGLPPCDIAKANVTLSQIVDLMNKYVEGFAYILIAVRG